MGWVEAAGHEEGKWRRPKGQLPIGAHRCGLVTWQSRSCRLTSSSALMAAAALLSVAVLSNAVRVPRNNFWWSSNYVPTEATTVNQDPVLYGDGMGGAGQVRLPPPSQHHYTIIFLHGLGDTTNITALPDYLERQGYPFTNTKYIIPVGEERRITQRRSVRGWAALTTTNDPHVKEDEKNLRWSAQRVKLLIENEIAGGIPTSNIAIGGFSQGGAVAYLTAMEFDKPLAALFALSCWVPLMDTEVRSRDAWPENPIRLSTAALQTPVLHCHGTRDPLILPQWGQLSVDHLRQQGAYVEEHLFDAEHNVVEEELYEVAQFLKRRFAVRRMNSGQR